MKNVVVVGFPKCGTSALARALGNEGQTELIISRSGSLEMGWPEVVEVEKEQPPSNKNRVHKRAAYIYSPSALKYLAEEESRQFIICIRKTASVLISWHNMHRLIALNGTNKDHFAWKERDFYIDCTLQDYFLNFAKDRLNYDYHIERMLKFVPSERVAVVTQEKMAQDMGKAVAFCLETAAIESGEHHIAFADGKDDLLTDDLRSTLARIDDKVVGLLNASGIRYHG